MITRQRPKQLLAVLGTSTEVGKTWFATQLLTIARASGWSVAARKPAQSFNVEELAATDAELLAGATGESPQQICPPHRWYPLAMAPPMAADALGRPRVLIKELISELTWPNDLNLGLIETAGGTLSPIAHDGDNLDFLTLLTPDYTVLIADAELGTINAVRLSLQALHAIGNSSSSNRAVVFLNRFNADNDLHRRNQEWLRDAYGVHAVTDIAACWSQLAAYTVNKPNLIA